MQFNFDAKCVQQQQKDVNFITIFSSALFSLS